jgi:long-chain acyl-CoA synthetase
MPIQHVGEGRVYDDPTLADRSLRAATALANCGVGEGDTIALFLRNDYALFEATIAGGQLGAYVVPINWHSTAQEFEYIIRDCGAKALIAHADLLPRIESAIPTDLVTFVVPTPSSIRLSYRIDLKNSEVPAGLINWTELVDSCAAAASKGRRPAEPIIYTSGTTGNPKGVKRMPTSPVLIQHGEAVASAVFGISPGMRTVMTAPMYHSAPSSFGLRGILASAHIFLQPRFEAEELLHLIERERISHLYMVPTMFVRLLKLPSHVRERYSLSSLRWVVHAAAPCAPSVKRAMIEWWGPIIREYFGTTETNAITYCDSRQWLDRQGTVGKVLDGTNIRIYGENGTVLGPGEIGEIYMHSDLCPDFAYHNAPEKRRAVERDGFITAGDIGYLDTENYLFLCGRHTDIVISGGVNIYPTEIEMALIGMPGVRDCCVFGIPDDEMGEKLAAVIEPDGIDLSERAVQDWLRSKLSSFKIPRLVLFRSELPREDSGKIFKRKLRDAFWAEAGRSI